MERTTEPTRPSTLAEMRKRLSGFITPSGREQGLALALRPTDVVITPFGKSGTTWTQQIVHTLRTRGDMDFDDISRVVPWIETSCDLGLDLDGDQKAAPRAFKSHLTWEDVPKGGRYINVIRNPADVLVSMFHFQEGWFWEVGAVDIDTYATEDFLASRGYYKHLRSWWDKRRDDDVLYLAYEQMLQEPTETIRRIARFIGIALDDELLALTEAHASLEFMLQHKDRFDDALMRALSEDRCGLPPGSDSAKVRAGKAGSGSILSASTQRLMHEVWAEEVTAALGLADYESLLTALDES